MRDDIVNSFKEKKPANEGDEKKWIQEYVVARQKWLEGRKSELLQKTVYRTKCFQKLIDDNNWNLSEKPIDANGVKIK
ncbi:hypothetical protein AKO1_007017 [Acrasis kona]|uniref:Uncharacterized protein n=1 Tax=Acrasis kona TaxID=1008807 RepID=A0AAW2YUQ1_9EUKA